MRRKRKNLERKDLHVISKIKRKKFHPALHKISKEKCISQGCLFYMKEYGPRSHVARVIVKEALGILLLTSIISSVAGIGLESIKSHFTLIIPLIILLPALNNAIGGFGTIIGSKFTEFLYAGKIGRKWWKSEELKELLKFVYLVGFVSAIYISVLTFIGSILVGVAISLSMIFVLGAIAIITSMILLGVVFVITVYTGLKIYEKKEDPNNFLIPITTAVADFFTILIFAGLVFLIF